MISQESESKNEKNPQTTKSISAPAPATLLPENIGGVTSGDIPSQVVEPMSNIEKIMLMIAQQNETARIQNQEMMRRQSEEMRKMTENSDRQFELLISAISKHAQESNRQPSPMQRPDNGNSALRATSRAAISLEEFYPAPTVVGSQTTSTGPIPTIALTGNVRSTHAAYVYSCSVC